jgi:nitrite reductase (NADH) small subunit
MALLLHAGRTRPHWWSRRRSPAPPPPGWIDVAAADELLHSGRLVVAVLGTAVLLVNTRRGVFAVENRCPHRGTPLAGGAVRATAITCPMHGWRYDLRSGACLNHPAALRTWPARITAGRVWLSAG